MSGSKREGGCAEDLGGDGQALAFGHAGRELVAPGGQFLDPAGGLRQAGQPAFAAVPDVVRGEGGAGRRARRRAGPGCSRSARGRSGRPGGQCPESSR